MVLGELAADHWPEGEESPELSESNEGIEGFLQFRVLRRGAWFCLSDGGSIGAGVEEVEEGLD